MSRMYWKPKKSATFPGGDESCAAEVSGDEGQPIEGDGMELGLVGDGLLDGVLLRSPWRRIPLWPFLCKCDRCAEAYDKDKDHYFDFHGISLLRLDRSGPLNRCAWIREEMRRYRKNSFFTCRFLSSRQ
jgi:hypothetical protein